MPKSMPIHMPAGTGAGAGVGDSVGAIAIAGDTDDADSSTAGAVRVCDCCLFDGAFSPNLVPFGAIFVAVSFWLNVMFVSSISFQSYGQVKVSNSCLLV